MHKGGRLFSLTHPDSTSGQIQGQTVQNLHPFWVGSSNFSTCHCCHQRHRAARTFMAGNMPGCGASTLRRMYSSALISGSLRREVERDPNAQVSKPAHFPLWQKAQLCRQRVLRGWCSCAAAGLWMLDLSLSPTSF